VGRCLSRQRQAQNQGAADDRSHGINTPRSDSIKSYPTSCHRAVNHSPDARSRGSEGKHRIESTDLTNYSLSPNSGGFLAMAIFSRFRSVLLQPNVLALLMTSVICAASPGQEADKKDDKAKSAEPLRLASDPISFEFLAEAEKAILK